MANRMILTSKGQEIQHLISQDLEYHEALAASIPKNQTKKKTDESAYLLQQYINNNSSLNSNSPSTQAISRVSKKFQLAITSKQDKPQVQQQMVDMFISDNGYNPDLASQFLKKEVTKYTNPIFDQKRTGYLHPVFPLKLSNFSKEIFEEDQSRGYNNNNNSNMASIQKGINNSSQQDSCQSNSMYDPYFIAASSNNKNTINQSNQNNLSDPYGYLPSIPKDNNNNPLKLQNLSQRTQKIQAIEDNPISFIGSQSSIPGSQMKSKRSQYGSASPRREEEADDENLNFNIGQNYSRQLQTERMHLENVKAHQIQNNYYSNARLHREAKPTGIASRGTPLLSQSQESINRSGYGNLSKNQQNSDKKSNYIAQSVQTPNLLNLNNSTLNSSLNRSTLALGQEAYVLEKCNAILNCEGRVERILQRYKKYQETVQIFESKLQKLKADKKVQDLEEEEKPPKKVQQFHDENKEIKEIMRRQDEYEQKKKERVIQAAKKKYAKVWQARKLPELTEKYKDIMRRVSVKGKFKGNDKEEDEGEEDQDAEGENKDLSGQHKQTQKLSFLD